MVRNGATTMIHSRHMKSGHLWSVVWRLVLVDEYTGLCLINTRIMMNEYGLTMISRMCDIVMVSG